MKKNNKSSLFLFISISFILISFSSCGGNKLTRQDAASMIAKKYNLPVKETTKLGKRYLIKSWGDAGDFGMKKICTVVGERYSDVKSKLDNLQSNGLITINENIEDDDRCHYNWANVVLTDLGKNYLVRDADGEFEVMTNEILFGEVSGIQMNDQMKVAQVDYTLQRTNFTPFGSSASHASIAKHSSFSLYDDGWRINN